MRSRLNQATSWARKPIRAKTYGKKRERGRNSYDFDREVAFLLRFRYGMPVYCVQSWRASRNGRNVIAMTGVLHAINRGANAGDHFASNTTAIDERNPLKPDGIGGSRSHLPRSRALRASRYRKFSRGWAFCPYFMVLNMHLINAPERSLNFRAPILVHHSLTSAT